MKNRQTADKYDANGNVICEQDGSFCLNGDDSATYHKVTKESVAVTLE